MALPKTCSYCGKPVWQNANWRTIGTCQTHEKMWTEDVQSAFKQNRLRDMMHDPGSYYNKQK